MELLLASSLVGRPYRKLRAKCVPSIKPRFLGAFEKRGASCKPRWKDRCRARATRFTVAARACGWRSIDQLLCCDATHPRKHGAGSHRGCQAAGSFRASCERELKSLRFRFDALTSEMKPGDTAGPRRPTKRAAGGIRRKALAAANGGGRVQCDDAWLRQGATTARGRRFDDVAQVDLTVFVARIAVVSPARDEVGDDRLASPERGKLDTRSASFASIVVDTTVASTNGLVPVTGDRLG
jgi:hypothetical protein